MARRSKSPLGYVFGVTSKLPWWVGISIALISYFILHWYVTQELPQVSGAEAMGSTVFSERLRNLATLGQYLLPVFFLTGTFISLCKTFKKANQ